MRSPLSSRLVVGAALATALLLVPANAAVAEPSNPPSPPSASVVQVRTHSPTPNVSVPAGNAQPAAATYPGYTLDTGSDGAPIRWNPCRTIHYRVNAIDGGPGALADVMSALEQLTAVSGLQFVYDGPSNEIPLSGYGRTNTPDAAPPLLIAWAAPGNGPSRSNLLSEGGEIGDGGWSAMSWTGTDGVAHALQIVSGFVVLNAPTNLAPGFGPANGTTRGRLLLHELGHVVGLNHTGDANQVMYPTVDGRAGTYAAGDQAGLAQVGAQAGCIGPGTPPLVTPPPAAASWARLISLLGSWFAGL